MFKKSKKNNVAIIGISCKFPGEANDPQTFWELLINQKEIIQNLPSQRWQWPENIDVSELHRGIDKGGFLNRLDLFDAAFFKISPREARLMDPQQRMLLEMSWHCFQDAGYHYNDVTNTNTGVFVGISSTDYHELLVQSPDQTGGYLSTGSGLFAAANRLSYFYHLTGPSLSIDTASSSSLVALCQAVEAINNNICTQALVGGINLICTPTNSISYYQAGMLSPEGKCQSFDAGANGYVRGEGGAVLLLKSFDQALRDGDQIYGVIRAAGHRHGGHTHSITVPSAAMQAVLMEEVYRRSKIDIDTISYIETHGSGTPIGDPVEIEGLKLAFSSLNRSARKYCGLGSVKSNIGHLEAASGLASVIKVVMAMKHRQLPATRHHYQLNPNISLDNSPFYIVTKNQEWASSILRAGVSSFGLGGVNAHVLIEEPPSSYKPKRRALPLQGFIRESYWISGTQSIYPLNHEKKPNTAHSINDHLKSDICQIISKILHIPFDQIETTVGMSDLGFDSLAFRELCHQLNETFGLKLSPVIFFEVHTIEKLIQYLRNDYELNQKKSYTSLLPPTSNSIEDIAIIGMAAELPQSNNLDEFWHHLIEGHDLISLMPEDRFNRDTFFIDDPDAFCIRRGGFIKKVAQFDAAFFNISPLEAELMDPQHRRFIQVVWRTIENAGITPETLSESKTGVFVGVMTSDYNDLLIEKQADIKAYTPIGTANSMLANRVSFLFNLNGPSETIDTACSSSLVALHRAVESLQHNECNAAFVGGVNLILSPKLSIAFNKAGMLSKDSYCKTFDKHANGYVRSEGVTALLLKPLSKAIADGNQIHAIIKASAVNHGGRATSLTAPNINAQADLLVTAYNKANIHPATVNYIELHGTGTSLGDPVEFAALKKAFQRLSEQHNVTSIQPTCGLGSVKSNMGHAEAAAGLAGLLKVVLAMKHKAIPGNLHFTEKNPLIDFTDSPFYFIDKQQSWPVINNELGKSPRRAGISSFGFGGVNAHVILEEYRQEDNNELPKFSSKLEYSFADTTFWIPDKSHLPIQLINEQNQLILKHKIALKCDEFQTNLKINPEQQHIVVLIGPEQLVSDTPPLAMIENLKTKGVICYSLQVDDGCIGSQYQSYAIGVFEIIKSQLKNSPSQSAIIQVITKNDEANRVLIGISALLKTAHLENPSLKSQFISIDRKLSCSEWITLLNLNKLSSETEIKYESDHAAYHY
jgi:acyl transferase domain-containing protein/acyl carrier protein